MNRTDRNTLVIANLPLVGYLVTTVWASTHPVGREELASAGALALITSAEAYDPTFGVPFGAFARRRILGAFADEMRAGDWATRSARRRITHTRAVHETLRAALGRNPSLSEIADALGVDRVTAEAGLSDAARTLTALDDTTLEFLPADTVSPDELLLSGESSEYLRAAVAALPEKMRSIVEQIYFNERAVKDIAAALGTTHSAVSQTRAAAIRLLRDGLGVHYSDDGDTTCAYRHQSRIAPARHRAYLARLADRVKPTPLSAAA